MSDAKILLGKSALITGAAQGIGLGIARRLAADGAQVVLADLNLDQAKRQAEALRTDGLEASGAFIDVTDKSSVESLSKSLQPVDILINNAGISLDTHILESADSAWRKVVDVNLFGVIHCTQTFAPGMVERGWGRIINLGSLLSETAFGRDFGYVMTKTAVLGLTRSVSADLAGKGVTVNAICPGNVMTDMMRELAPRIEARDGLPPGSFLIARAKAIPAGRLAEPEDIAAMAAFLCRDDAKYVTGQSLHVNGGLYYH